MDLQSVNTHNFDKSYVTSNMTWKIRQEDFSAGNVITGVAQKKTLTNLFKARALNMQRQDSL